MIVGEPIHLGVLIHLRLVKTVSKSPRPIHILKIDLGGICIHCCDAHAYALTECEFEA